MGILFSVFSGSIGRLLRHDVLNVLRNMDVGAIEVFPIIQKTSVTYTLNARLYKEKAEGMVWKTKSDVKNMQFIVTRIA